MEHLRLNRFKSFFFLFSHIITACWNSITTQTTIKSTQSSTRFEKQNILNIRMGNGLMWRFCFSFRRRMCANVNIWTPWMFNITAIELMVLVSVLVLMTVAWCVCWRHLGCHPTSTMPSQLTANNDIDECEQNLHHNFVHGMCCQTSQLYWFHTK